MEVLITIGVAIAGGASLPFVVGYFVHIGAAEIAPRAHWMFESRPRLLAQSSYYFVAMGTASAASAVLVFYLPQFDGGTGWVFPMALGSSLVGIPLYQTALKIARTDCLTGRMKRFAREWGPILLFFIPLVGWFYVARIVSDRWGETSSEDPMNMPLPLILLLLAPLVYITFSRTSQIWGVLFASEAYRYPEVTVVAKTTRGLGGPRTIRGGLVRETAGELVVMQRRNLLFIDKSNLSIARISQK